MQAQIDTRFFAERMRDVVRDEPKAFAYDLGLSLSAVYNYLNGRVPTTDVLFRIARYSGRPMESVGELFSEAFFPDHPLGLNIAGTPKLVKSFDRGKTFQYHADTYHAGNLVIAAAGNIEHDRIVDLAEKAFSSSAKPPVSRDAHTPVMAAPILIKQNKNLEQAHVIIATPLVGARDDRRYAADLLANIIGGGTSSRLWQKVREERGLAYSVGASAIMYQDCGMFSVFAGTSPDQVLEVVDLSVAEMREVVRGGVTQDELDLAKQQTTASILLGLEDSAARAATLAQSEMIHGRQIPLDETLENLNAVTTEAPCTMRMVEKPATGFRVATCTKLAEPRCRLLSGRAMADIDLTFD